MKRLKMSIVVLLVVMYVIGNKGIAASASSSINIAYNNQNLQLQWYINRDSLQKDPNENRMSVQNFSRYGSTNVFFLTQHYLGNTYLYRCTLGNDGYITAQDHVILSGYGHGESVEVTGYDSSTNTYTVWVGATEGSATYYWSKDIARVKYTIDSASTTGATITESKTITALNGVTGSTDLSFRTSVCVAENDNRICICTQLDDENGDWYYIIYALSDLNTAVNGITGSSASLSSLGVTIKSSFSMSDTGLPNASFQSIDTDGVGSNNKMLFLAGGGHTDNCQVDQYLYTNGGTTTKLYEYIILNSQAPSNNFLYNAEIEGIKIYSDNGVDYIYMMFKQQNATFSRIYRYPVQ